MSAATLSFLPSPVDLARQLAEADPGPDMIAMLGLLDPASMSADDRLYVVQAWERVCAWAAAQAQAAVAAFSVRGSRSRPPALTWVSMRSTRIR